MANKSMQKLYCRRGYEGPPARQALPKYFLKAEILCNQFTVSGRAP